MAAAHAIGSRESDRSTPPSPPPPLPPTQAQAQQSRPDSSMSQASATGAADYAPSPNTSSLALSRANQLRIQALLRRLLLASSDLAGSADSHGESAHIDTLRVLRKTLREIDYNLSWLTQVDLLETLERILVANDESCNDINNDHARDQLEQRRRWRQDEEDWNANANASSSHNNNDGLDDDQADDHNGAPMQPVGSSSSSSSWRLIHDTSQLLLEALPRLRHEIGPEIIESIVPIAVENLGHSRSEVRRASLLLLNTLMRQLGPIYFDSILRLFIDYGPANCRNKQAQRGAILSLPLLIGKPIVDSHNLLPLVRCLSELLVDDSNNNEQLFYSLYLALQRLHLMMGDAKFATLMSRCEPEAMHLYRQAASRHNSLVGSGECSTSCAGSGGANDRQTLQDTGQGAAGNNNQRSVSNCSPSPSSSSSRSPSLSPSPSSASQHVPVQVNQADNNNKKLEETQRRRQSASVSERQPAAPPPPMQPVDGQSTGRLQQHVTFENDVSAPLPVPAPLSATASCEPSRTGRQSSLDSSSPSSSSSSSSLSTMIGCNSPAAASVGNRKSSGAAAAAATAAGKRDFSSDVSSTCSSDAHLVNPAHYMTKAALHGNPLANYDQIHHIDHSQVDSLAINDFGPICNTPTMEVAPQLNYLTTIRSFPNRSPTSGGGGGGGGGNNSLLIGQQQSAGGASLILQDDSLSRSELKFGILPRQLISISLNAALRSTDRYEAMQELMCIIRESPINHLAILMTYFDSFLEQFVAKLLVNTGGPKAALANSSGATMVHQQTSLKLSLIAIDMLETIVIKTKVSTMQYIRPIVGLLLRALGHSHHADPAPTTTPVPTSTTGSGGATTAGSGAHALQQALGAPLSPAAMLMRENTCRVMHKMMAYLPPQHVIDAIFEHKHSRSPLVREESINRVTAACLEYDRNEFNLTKLCYHVLPMLADHAPTVRMAALECIATLAHILGPSRIGSLLTAAEAVQTNCDYDGLLSAIHARLLRHALPRCHSNGLIKYVIKPFLFQSAQLLSAAAAAVKPASSNDTQQQQQVAAAAGVAADIRWVLEAPSSHQHSSGPYYHPHAHAHSHSHQGGQVAACSPLDIATGHVNYGPVVGGTKHHRLGVYSPPSMAERRRRNSAINLTGATCPSEAQSFNSAQHFHEHHHAMHARLVQPQQQQQQQKGADNSQDDCAIATKHRKEQDPEEGRDRKASVSSKQQQQQVKALRKTRRDSSRGEPAAGSSANDTTTRRQSASRSSRQSICTLPQSKSDEVNQASSKVTSTANESSETKLVDERRESVQDANTTCQRRPSCAHGRSRASSLARDTSGSSCLATGAKNDQNPASDLSASNNNIGVDGKGDCEPSSKGARSGETNRKSGSLSQNASKGTNLMQQQQQQQQMSCECSVGNHQQSEKRQDDQRSRRKSSINNNNNSGGGGSKPKLPRSSSQDSVSSTDTNKLLFQYYLGKFRQSLAESPIGCEHNCNCQHQHQKAVLLPSDSIIYSDINQAYALSRHQSRYQQTSFETAPKNDSAGQHDYQSAGGRIVPTTTITTTTTPTKSSSPTSAVSKQQQQQHQLVSNQVNAISGQQADRSGGSGGDEMKSQHQQRQQRLTTNRHQTSSTTTTLRRQTSVADERAASGFDATGNNDLVRDQESQKQHHQQQQQRIGDASDVTSGADRRKSNATGNDTDSGRRRQSTGGGGGDKEGQRRRESQHFANTQDDDRKGTDGASLSSGTGSRASISRASLGAARRSSEHSAQVEDRRRRRKSLHESRSKSGEENQSNDLIDGQATTSNNNNNTNNSNNSLQRNESETTAPSISTVEYNLATTAGSGGNQDYRSSERPECRQETNTSGADSSNNNRSIKRNSLIDQGRHNSSGGDDEHDGDDDDDEHEHRSSGCQHRAHRSEARNSTTAVRDETGSDDRQQEAIAMRRRASRSQPPSASSQRHHQTELTSATSHKEAPKKRASDHHHHDQHHYNQQQQQHFQQQLKPLGTGGVGVRRSVSVSPSLSNSVNIRHILENVAQIEGNFVDAQLAYKVAMDALDSPCWSTKVEGILALIRLVTHHAQYIVQPTSGVASGRLHEIVLKLTNEIGNLRSTVARSAIFALGDFCAKLGRSIEPEMDIICRALLQKSTENTGFIRDDIKRALNEMVNSLTPWRLTNSLIAAGAQHKSANVRRMASQFVAQLVVDHLGAPKCLVGSREISSTLLPAASKFAQDNSPYTRYYGRLILSKLMYHSAFDRLLRRNLTSTLYRSTVGIIESIRRRGPGELPQGD